MLATMAAEARTPGYMGLRWMVQYQGGFSPQWEDFGKTMPYYNHNLQIGYVVNRKIEVGLQYTYMRYNNFYYSGPESYTDGGTGINIDNRLFTGYNVMAYIKLYRHAKGMIAPVGRYLIIGMTYQYSTDKFHVIEDKYSPASLPAITNVRSHDISIGIGVGKNYIFARRILLSLEADFNMPLSSAVRAGQNRYPYPAENSITSKPNLYKRANALDVMLTNLISIRIGFGVLAF